MRTEWDDDRLDARVERTADGAGFWVLLYDSGPLGHRHACPKLLTDSKRELGKAGVWPDRQRAQPYADLLRDAHQRFRRESESIRIERSLALADRQQRLLSEREELRQQKRRAAADEKRITREIETLVDEASRPDLGLTIYPDRPGFEIFALPCVTDGNAAGDPRQLLLEQVVPADGPRTIVSTTGRSQAVDATGLPIGLGSVVEFADPEGDEYEATVTSIDEVGPQLWRLEAEDLTGKPWDLLSTECTRREDVSA